MLPIRSIPLPRPARPRLPRGLRFGRAEEPERLAKRGADDYPMTVADFGRATEARFVFAATQRGLLVSTPSCTLPSYDVVVDNGLRLFKVQVKGVHALTGKAFGPHHNRIYPVHLWPLRRKYPPRFDVCAVYMVDEDQWVFFDSSCCTRRTLVITTHGKHTRVGWEIFRPRTREKRAAPPEPFRRTTDGCR